MGKTKRDGIRNAHVRQDHWVEDIQKEIKGNRLRYVAQAERIDEQRIPKDYWK
jgi:hypothetical protein